MAAIGPRVGGAHVDVNMKFDEKSVGEVGKRIHKQLSTLSKDIAKVGDRNREVYRSIGRDAVVAWRALLGSILAGGPHMGSAISAVAGAATTLAGSLYSSVQASYALGPIITSIGLAGLTASIGMRNFGAAVSETNPKQLKEFLKDMPKSMQAAVMSTRSMAKEMRAVIWAKMFVGVGPLMARLRQTGVIQRGLGKMATSINGLVRGVLRYTSSAKGVSTLNKFFDNNAKVFAALSKAAVPFLDGFLRLMNALTPAAIRLSNRITDLANRFDTWTKKAGFGKRINDMMKGAEKTAGLLWHTLTNLGSAILNIFNAANPATNTFLKMLEQVTKRFKDWTASAKGKNQIAKWAQGSVGVMKQLGKTIAAVFSVTSKLANPRVIISFLKTVEGAFKLLAKLPLDKMVTAFVTISEKFQPLSSFFLAFIAGAAAVNILIGNMIGQMGGLFSVILRLVMFRKLIKTFRETGGGANAAGKGAEGAAKKGGLLRRAWAGLLGLFTKIRAAFAKVVGFFTKGGEATGEVASKASRLGKVFRPLLSILGRFAKFAGFVGIAVWVGILIAKSDKLKKKLGTVWDSMKGVATALKGAFKDIGDALKPLAPAAKGVGHAIGPVMDIFDKIATLAIGVVLDSIVYGFKSLANVIKGAGRIIAGIIKILIGLFTLDFGKVWDGLKEMFSGIGPLLHGVFGLFVTFFAPARLAKIGMFAFRGLGRGFLRAAPKVLSIVGRLLLHVLKFFGRLPGRLLALGGRAIAWLARAVVKNGPRVISGAFKIYVGIVKWILKLPGRLLQLGGEAISKLGGAMRRGIGALRNIAGDIVSSVVSIIRGLPGKLLNLGGSLLSAGRQLGGKILSGIGDGLRAIGDMAGNIAGDLRSGINHAIGLPRSVSLKVLGKHIGFTIPGFAKGTSFAPGGVALVGEAGPELVNLPRGSKVHTASQTRRMERERSALPRKVILRIGSREFEAYVEEIADGRIDAADSLAYQGA